MTPPADSIKEIVKQLDKQLAVLRPIVAEYEKLQAARAVLVGDGAGPAAPRGSVSAGTGRRPAPRRRAPRGANRAAILAYVGAHPGATAAQIAEATGIARATMQTTIYQLKRKGDLEPEGDGVMIPSAATARAAQRRSAARRRAAAGRRNASPARRGTRRSGSSQAGPSAGEVRTPGASSDRAESLARDS